MDPLTMTDQDDLSNFEGCPVCLRIPRSHQDGFGHITLRCHGFEAMGASSIIAKQNWMVLVRFIRKQYWKQD